MRPAHPPDVAVVSMAYVSASGNRKRGSVGAMDPRLNGLVRDFAAGLDALGLDHDWGPAPSDDPGWDLVGTIEQVAVAIQARSSVRSADLDALVSATPSRFPILLARRVSADARALLERRGIGFFDGRGHLRLWHRPLLVDTTLRAIAERQHEDQQLRVDVPSMLDVALAVLDGIASKGVRAAALRIGRSPGTVSKHLATLRRSHLVSEGAEAVGSGLFDAVLDVWRLQRLPLAGAPGPGHGPVAERLQLGLEDPAATGWTLADASAAAWWGAPIMLAADAPPDFYVPDASALRQARTLLGDAHNGQHACTVAVAPAPFVCRNRYYRTPRFETDFPAPSAAVAALDLASDPARGREALDLWSHNLSPEVRRVW